MSLCFRGAFTAIGIIYKEQGVKGFFCGFIPRLLCDLAALWLGKTLAHIINNYLLEDRDLKQYVSASMNVSIVLHIFILFLTKAQFFISLSWYLYLRKFLCCMFYVSYEKTVQSSRGE